MKNIFRLLFVMFTLFTTTIPLHSQSPDWIWAKSAGESSAHSVTTDASGNIFMAGEFSGRYITFGSFTLMNTDTSGGFADMFLVKYAPNGNVLWAKSAGGKGDAVGGGVDLDYSDMAYSVTTDASGNIFVAGQCSGRYITFGSFILTPSPYMNAIFLVKYDNSGNVIWAKSAGGSDALDWVYSVTTDASGNIFIAGEFHSSTITFGSFTLTKTGPSASDIFLAKYDNSGNVLWAKSAGGKNNNNVATSVTADASGNIFVAGVFDSDTINFGSFTLTNAYPGSAAMFLVKYDNSGNVIWAKSTDNSWANSVTADASGNIFVASRDLVKYDANGNVLWTKSFNWEQASSITTDASGNIFVAGDFMGGITFGSFTLPSAGGRDVFVTEYDNSGNVLWAKSAGGISPDYAHSVTVDGSGNIFVAGEFEARSITFGSITLTNAGNTSSTDMYLAKLSSITGVEENNIIPNEFYLSQNYPNPFNPTTKINFSVPKSGFVTIKVFDVLGREVATLVNENKLAGNYSVQLNAGKLVSGIYFYKFMSVENIETRKMILLK